jgi:hypothetical protein
MFSVNIIRVIFRVCGRIKPTFFQFLPPQRERYQTNAKLCKNATALFSDQRLSLFVAGWILFNHILIQIPFYDLFTPKQFISKLQQCNSNILFLLSYLLFHLTSINAIIEVKQHQVRSVFGWAVARETVILTQYETCAKNP